MNMMTDIGQLALLDRSAIEAQIEAMIALLDAMDGDPDLEEDDPCGQIDEDDFNTMTSGWYHGNRGPGCELSDPDV